MKGIVGWEYLHLSTPQCPYSHCAYKDLRDICIYGLLPKSPGANIKEFLLTILSEAEWPQI